MFWPQVEGEGEREGEKDIRTSGPQPIELPLGSTELVDLKVYLCCFKIMISCFAITAYIMSILPPKHLNNAFTSL